MSSRGRTALVVVIGALFLGGGLTLYLIASSRAEDATADLRAASDAEQADREALTASRDLDREISQALADARLYANSVDPVVRPTLEDAAAHRRVLQDLLANAEQSAAAMRAEDGDAFNGTIDRYNELLDQARVLNETVDSSVSDVSRLLAQVSANYDEALLAGGR